MSKNDEEEQNEELHLGWRWMFDMDTVALRCATRTHAPRGSYTVRNNKKKKQKSPRSSVSNNGEKGQEKRKINWFNLETKSSRQRSGRFVFEERVAPSGV